MYALQPLDHEELELLQFQVSARDAGVPPLGCMDELVCAPSLCAFPQPGLSLSLPLFIWLTIPWEAFTWAVFLLTFPLTWEGLGETP